MQSALWPYLNPKSRIKAFHAPVGVVLPFGANSSQLKALHNALTRQLSIIQDPPGTGKTQTILNIISNLLLRKKTVLVVSNNNSATGNIYEKLAKDKFDFLCARLGKRENIERFLSSQSEDYPKELKEWICNEEVTADRLRKDLADLEARFSLEEKLVSTRMILSSVRTEYEHFKIDVIDNPYDCRKASKLGSDRLMMLHEKLRMKYADKLRLS